MFLVVQLEINVLLCTSDMYRPDSLLFLLLLIVFFCVWQDSLLMFLELRGFSVVLTLADTHFMQNQKNAGKMVYKFLKSNNKEFLLDIV